MRSLLDPKFVYRNAAETSQPGYLAKRFAEIRLALATKKHEVVPIRKVAK